MDLSFIDVRIGIRLSGSCADRHAFFSLRSGFEEAFREIATPESRVDDGDPAESVFGRRLTSDPAALKRFQKPSLPFIFSLPILPASTREGLEVEAGLRLLGPGISHLPLFVHALDDLLRRGDKLPRGVITRIDSLNYGGDRSRVDTEKPLLSPGLHILSFEGLQHASVLPYREIKVVLETPLRLLHKGHPVRHLDFSCFMPPLLRRVSSIVYYYGGKDMDVDFGWLAREGRKIATETAGIRWERWGGKGDGLVGTVTFRGDLADYHPFLLLGEYLQLGKGSSYGFGRYRIETG